MGIIHIRHLYWKFWRRMSLVACKRLLYTCMLFQFEIPSLNYFIHFCSDFISGGIFLISNLYV